NEGADVNAKAVCGNTPLHHACIQGSVDILTLLLNEGADANARNPNGNTPLHLAAFHNNLEVAKLLLNVGVDPTIKNNNGQTTLMFESYTLRMENEVIKFLKLKEHNSKVVSSSNNKIDAQALKDELN